MEEVILLSFLVGMFVSLVLNIIIWRYLKRKMNNVHFYVARDSDDKLHLWLGKPIRLNSLWSGFCSWRIDGRFTEFRILGVYQELFRNLEWDDEPVEVYLNLD